MKPVSKSKAAAALQDPSERYVIPNLRNACRILKYLGEVKDGVKPADINKELGIPVTTSLRIMATLHLEGLVRKVDGRFALGPVMIQLGQRALNDTELRDLAAPIVAQLSAKTEETAHLAIPCDYRPLILVVQDSPHPLRAASRPGTLAEVHCSATGKVFLAYLYADRIAAVLEKTGLRKRTPATMTSIPALSRQTAVTRKNGYATDEEEYHPGVRCLAAPVYGANGDFVAALGITASVARFPKARTEEIAAVVIEAASELSQLLGHR